MLSSGWVWFITHTHKYVSVQADMRLSPMKPFIVTFWYIYKTAAIADYFGI